MNKAKVDIEEMIDKIIGLIQSENVEFAFNLKISPSIFEVELICVKHQTVLNDEGTILDIPSTYRFLLPLKDLRYILDKIPFLLSKNMKGN